MTSMDVTLIIDDRDPQIQYNCPAIKQTVKGSYYRDTWTTIDSLSCGEQSGWFSHIFNGTQTRIWGSASQSNQNYSVKIDDGPFIVQSGDEDGLHTVVYAAGVKSLYPTFDYLTVTAGPSTQLFGRTVIVDDSEIAEYSGEWSTQSPSLSQLPLLRPSAVHRNTTHWTSTVGDTFTFQFNGNSVSVYGVVPNDHGIGNCTAAYIVDGVQTVMPVPEGSNQVQTMLQFFHADLEAGMHTLVFNITEVSPSHVIGIDFVLRPVNSPVVASSNKTNHTHIIVGATLGSLAALALLASLFFLYRRSRKTKATSKWVVTKTNQ
ncbi:hypothetical protein FB451DRAFT_1271832 [Mycena latifolia]|nr:hypothetical protein FB451DRAFT_1271832 [Mycena latifolia]